MNINSNPEGYVNVLQILHSTLDEYSTPKHPLYGGLYTATRPDILGSDKDTMFLIMSKDPAFDGTKPLPEGFDIYGAVRREARGDNVFYPGMRVIPLDGLKEDTTVTQSIVLWARRNEFLSRVYDKYGATVPDRIRGDEIDFLSERMQIIDDKAIPFEEKKKVVGQVGKFFRMESATGFRKRWVDFCRSDKNPGAKNRLKQLWYFLRRKSNVVPLDHLWKHAGTVCAIPMTERDYKKFAKAVKTEFPELTYAVSKRVVRDEGLKAWQRADKTAAVEKQRLATGWEMKTPEVRHVSEDEYAAIREKRFADEGWECLQDLEPVKFELRKVYVKGEDVSLAAGILSRYRLSWARPYSMDEIVKYGQCRVREVEERDFANFVSLAKYNHVPFAIDTEGVARYPAANVTNVVYPVCFEKTVTAIFNRIVNDAIGNSHDDNRTSRPRKGLMVDILRAEEISREERAGRTPKRELPPKERQ